jgi:hypothetical protein
MSCPHLDYDRSDKLLPGQIVLRCKSCKMLSVEGAGKWIKGGANWQERLKVAAGLTEMAADRDLQERRHQEMISSDISDPRWTRI